jgi:ankyrin repeat protein
VEYNAEIDARARFTADGLGPGSKMEARLNIGRTPLMEAAWGGQEEAVELLLDLGADIDAIDNHGMTSLIQAARCGHEKVVKILLTRGANAMVKDKNGWTANDWLSAK